MARMLRPLIVATVIATTLPRACDSGTSTPPPDQQTDQNPCDAALAQGTTLRGGVVSGTEVDKSAAVDHEARWRVLDSIWHHRAGLDRGLVQPLGPDAVTEDVGEIAVLQDEGDLVLRSNPLDLLGAGLRFTRNASGGYDVTRTDATFREPLGAALTLGDDDSREVSLPFAVPFFGQTETAVFVNSDGNLTFGQGDNASSPRSVSRLLTGPPRSAPFFADLDPSSGGGVFLQSGADAFSVTWCAVPAFGQPQATATVQMTFLPAGTVEVKIDESTRLDSAVVGLSPGRTGTLAAVDLSEPGPTAGGGAAVGERFSRFSDLDAVNVVRRFYQTHADVYDQLVIWSDSILLLNAFAYEVTLGNEIQGIGLDLFDLSSEFGSAGQLRSLAVMDSIDKYPDDPFESFLGANNTLSILGQEVGHRWLAFVRFLDHNRLPSDALLGRGAAHWSFFLDSDASVMEGNAIEDRGGGAFRTVAAVERYSELDQYLMGVRAESEVSPFFYVADPLNAIPAVNRSSEPQAGVTFNGTRRDALIQDVVDVEGPRVPSAADAPRVHRQAFVFVVGEGRTHTQAQIDKLERIRQEWVTFFSTATGDRMRAETRLNP